MKSMVSIVIIAVATCIHRARVRWPWLNYNE